MNFLWKPPKSPHGLLQESLWPDEWKILVSCLLLNLTTRKQVDKVVYKLFNKYPCPASMVNAAEDELYNIVKSLGLANKRVKTLKRFSREYITKDWVTPKELYGCGKYADDAWRIFCRGDWRDVEPKDHALNDYFNYLSKISGGKNARRT